MEQIQKELPRATGAAQEALLAEKLELKRRLSTLFGTGAVTPRPAERLNMSEVRVDSVARERE
jgi:hypothetical protein